MVEKLMMKYLEPIEKPILKLIAQYLIETDMENKEIAEKLNLNHKTVIHYSNKIFDIYGCNGRKGLQADYVRICHNNIRLLCKEVKKVNFRIG